VHLDALRTSIDEKYVVDTLAVDPEIGSHRTPARFRKGRAAD
jgi:hypothetical protein